MVPPLAKFDGRNGYRRSCSASWCYRTPEFMKCHVFTVLCLTLALETIVCAQQAELDVRDAVRDPESFPRSYREQVNAYDVSAVPQLLELLGSKAEEVHWTRIAGLLGAIGDERAVEGLIAFIESPSETERLSFEHYHGRRQAIMSLGVIVNHTGSERALAYLVDGLTPSVWRQRKVQGIATWTASYEDYDRELSTYALMGLALSGHPRAREALTSLQQSPTLDQAQSRNGLDSTLRQWLEVHELVAERGVAGMYDHYEAQERIRIDRETEEANRLRAEKEERRPPGTAPGLHRGIEE